LEWNDEMAEKRPVKRQILFQLKKLFGKKLPAGRRGTTDETVAEEMA